MALTITAPPTSEPVTLAEVKAFARVEHSGEDAVITGAIKAVTAWLAGPSGWLGRSLCDQTIELRTAVAFSLYKPVVLPRPPLLQVLSVVYLDTDGATEIAIPPSDRRTFIGDDGLPRINMAAGWPGQTFNSDNLIICYRAGYGTTLDPARPVDDGIRQGIIELAARIFDERSTAVLADHEAQDSSALQRGQGVRRRAVQNTSSRAMLSRARRALTH